MDREYERPFVALKVQAESMSGDGKDFQVSRSQRESRSQETEATAGEKGR